jgi:hypothetical protein
MFRSWFRKVAHNRMVQAVRRHKTRLTVEVLEDRAVPSANPGLGDVFYIDMENHNFTQPASFTGVQQVKGNAAVPYLNSLITPGNPNAAQTSYASNYINAAVGNHPSEPNYVWQEAGVSGTLNDADPYTNTPNNIVNSPNLSGLLQAAGIPWKTYQEDIDLQTNDGSPINQPTPGHLTSTVASPSDWTVPLVRFSGTSADYTNPYNGSHQYNFAPKHDGTLFFTDTNGGNNLTSSNPEAKYYAPLQQLQTDLNNNTVARYSLITPDQYNDMHSSLNTDFTYAGQTWAANTDGESIALGDNFLSKIVPQIMASQAYKHNGAIVIWFDESEGPEPASDSPGTGFTIGEIVISPLAKGNAYTNNIQYTHSSDLKSLEKLFEAYAPGGGFLGDANTPGTNDLSDLFKPGALRPTELAGKVFLANEGGQGVSGLMVTLTGTDALGQAVNRTTTTAFDGTYSFAGLLAGTYKITIASDPGTVNGPATPHGSRDDIVLHQGQTRDELDFALFEQHEHHSHHHHHHHHHHGGDFGDWVGEGFGEF